MRRDIEMTIALNVIMAEVLAQNEREQINDIKRKLRTRTKGYTVATFCSGGCLDTTIREKSLHTHNNVSCMTWHMSRAMWGLWCSCVVVWVLMRCLANRLDTTHTAYHTAKGCCEYANFFPG